MASNYGTVDTGVWKHYVFKNMSDDSKLLFLYLKTCGHGNMIGCFHLPIMYICADLKWNEKKVKQTLSELFANGFVRVDFDVEYTLLPKHLEKHPLQNPNQAKGAINQFYDIPSKFKYINDIKEILNGLETVKEQLPNGLETVWNSITDTNTVTDTETITNKTIVEANASTVKSSDIEIVLDFINSKTGKDFQLKNPKGALTANALKIKDRLKDGYTVQQCKTVIARKSNDWKDWDGKSNAMNPITLFRKSNFEKYLGECVIDE